MRPSNMSGGSTRWSSTLTRIMSSTCMQPARYLWQDPRMPGALDGVRVLDLSWGIAGPLGVLLLAEQGADVDEGRAARRRPVPRVRRVRGVEPVAAARSRVDLKTDAGRDAFHRLARRRRRASSRRSGRASPIVSASVTTRCTRATRALIYCSCPAYPDGHRLADRPGYDALVQASSGQQWEQPGWRHGPDLPAHADAEHGRVFLVPTGILGALIARENDGRGQHVRTSLFQGALLYTTQIWQHVEKAADVVPRPDGQVVPAGHAPTDDLRVAPTASGCTRRS